MRAGSRPRLLGAFWIAAGIGHFARPEIYRAIMPKNLRRWRRELVAASGAAEIAGGLAITSRRTRRLGRWWLLATVAGIFPANVHMALHAEDFRRFPEPLLWGRLPLQGLLAWWIWRATR